jgi:hypothetical protein
LREEGPVFRRIENPGVDEGRHGAVELDHDEFERFIAILEKNGAPREIIGQVRQAGFIAPLPREGSEKLFALYRMQSDVRFLSVCREGSLDEMKGYIMFCIREGTWPE